MREKEMKAERAAQERERERDASRERILTGTRREDRNVVTEKETVGRSWMRLVGSGEGNDLGAIGDGVRSTDGWMVVGWLGGWLSAGSKGGARSSFRGTVALRDRGSSKGEWGERG